MTYQTPKNASNFLKTENRDLQTILAKVKHLADVNKVFVNYLDANIRDYCQVANIVGHQLILVAANGSVATQIRFQSVDLLRKFKEDALLKSIQSIVCKVRPAPLSVNSANNVPVAKMQALSNETAALVQNIAESIEDANIRAALERIAKHTKKIPA